MCPLIFIVSHKGGHLFSQTNVSGLLTMFHVASVLLMDIGTNVLQCCVLTSFKGLIRILQYKMLNAFNFGS